MTQSRHFKLISLVLCVVIGSMALFFNNIQSKRAAIKPTISLNAATAFPAPQPLAKVSLIDDHGAPFNNERFNHHWSLVFLGYTHCPELCPATLSLMKTIAAQVPDGTLNAPLQLVLVSIDPDHDTPKHLSEFFARPAFKSAPFTGVTGEPSALTAFAKSLGAFVADNDNGTGHIEHSGALFVISPAGELVAVITDPKNVVGVTKDLPQLQSLHHPKA